MFVGRFDIEDVRRGGHFAVDAESERTGACVGVFTYDDIGDGHITVGFTAEFKGHEVQRALTDAADALRWRADQIAQVAPPMEKKYLSLIEEHRQHARVLEAHAREIAE